MPRRLNWGVLATGFIARKFAADLPGSRTGRLAAVASRSRERAAEFAREFGADRAHGSYQELLADPGVDAVYVATPHPQHVEWVVRAAEAGRHILCEKPLALDRAGAARAVEAARRHGVFLMEAFMYRCHPQTAALVRLVRDGAIGEVRLIRAAFSVAREFDAEHRLFKRELGGGAILDLGCYPVTFARLLAGAAGGGDGTGFSGAGPLEFKATGRLHPQVRTDEYAAAVAKFPGGVLAELSCGSTIVHDISARIYGSAGWLEVPTPYFPGLGGRDDRFLLHRPGAVAPEEFAFPGEGIGLYAREADAVGDALARGEREAAEMSHADSLGTAAVLDAWLAAVGVDYTGV